jgi:hypothetical protein
MCLQQVAGPVDVAVVGDEVVPPFAGDYAVREFQQARQAPEDVRAYLSRKQRVLNTLTVRLRRHSQAVGRAPAFCPSKKYALTLATTPFSCLNHIHKTP